MDQLFVMELLVDRIIFPTVAVPQKKQVIIQATCGSFANLEIRTDVMGALETQERSQKRVDLDIDCGKSLLFAMNPTELLKTLKDFPLQISVSTKLQTEPMGSAKVTWANEFLQMVEAAQGTTGYLTPVEFRDAIPLKKDTKPAGSIEIYLRLSYLGRNIDTHIQVIGGKGESGAPGGAPKQFLFKGNNNATTFQCQKYGLGSDADVIPVAPIYRTVVMPKASMQGRSMQRGSTQSLQSIMMGRLASMASMQSIAPSAFMVKGGMINPMYGMLPSTPSDAASIRERKVDKPYMNILDLNRNASSISDDDSEIDLDNLTVKQIEKLLCNHPDCPAAKMFKDYGIGPLAKGKGLGAMQCEVEAPVSYGLSHLNGRIDNYGPLGTYSRPKKPEDPFIPKSPVPSDCSSASTEGSDCGCGECLRLKGGGPICGTTNEIPDPKNACQDLMDEFNRLLTDYKNALGPCGQPTCPFAPNLVAETCKALCNPTDDTCSAKSPTPVEVRADNELKCKEDEMSACAIASCPYKRDIINPADKDHKKTQLKSACGTSTCPFVREKYSIDDGDPEFPPMPCAGQACPFKIPKDLPPIHWDCPDPLPKGECKNPCCPIANKEKIVAKYYPPAKSPCSSPTCPYAVKPCTFPGCPFQEGTAISDPCPPICPYTDPVPKQLECTSSTCPFATPKPAMVCDNPKCPYALASRKTCLEKKPVDVCDSGTCPFKKKPAVVCRTPPQEDSTSDICGHASCPFRKKPPVVCRTSVEEIPEICDNPTCPYKNQQEQQSEPICGNKYCPYNKPSANKSGSVAYDDVAVSAASKTRQSSSEPCTMATCKTHGGDLVCDECGDTLDTQSAKNIVKQKEIVASEADKGDIAEKKKKFGKPGKTEGGKVEAAAGEKPKKRKRRRRRGGYVYDEGTYYPGTKVGHRFCVLPKFNVPPDMGWLWNIHTACMQLRPRRGWKPGAIGRTIAKMINEHRKKLGMHLIDEPGTGKKHRRKGLGGRYGDDDSSEEEVQLKPTLQVKKKDGVVYVTMNPLKDPKTLEDNENPYMDCSPMQFKIVKNKQKEFKMCYCGEEECEDVDVSSTTSSELDIEFTPPAGIIRPERLRKKKNICHTDTQYNIADCALPKKPEEKGKRKGKGKGKGAKGAKAKKGKK